MVWHGHTIAYPASVALVILLSLGVHACIFWAGVPNVQFPCPLDMFTTLPVSAFWRYVGLVFHDAADPAVTPTASVLVVTIAV